MKPAAYRLSTVVAVLVTLGAIGTPGLAQTPTTQAGVGVELTPATIQQDLPNRAISSSVLVVNHEASPRQITLSVAGLGNSLDGNPEFLEPSAVSSAVHLSETAFTLGADERRRVTVTGSIPQPDPGFYASIVAEFAPLTTVSAGSVETHTRVASLVLLRAPRPWKETIDVVDVGVKPGAAGEPTQVYAAVKDTGNVHVRPTGTATITKDGVTLATVPLPGSTIIPGFARRLSGTWTPPPNLTGKVVIKVQFANPPGVGEGTASFDKSVAQQPGAKIVNLRAKDLGGPLITLSLANTGTLDLTPSVTLTASQNGIERGRVVLPVKSLHQGATTDLQWKPTLDDGIYLIEAKANDGATLLDEATTGLKVGNGHAAAVKRGGSGGGIRLAAAGLLVLVLVFGAVVFAVRRRPARSPVSEDVASSR